MCTANQHPSISMLRIIIADDHPVVLQAVRQIIQEEFPGISDEEVLKRATDLNYIILTFDRDYGELIFRYHLINPPAVIYFREKGKDPLFAGQRCYLY